MDRVKDTFIKTCEKHQLIEKGDGIVVGVSGGPDSMALLSLLCEVQDSLKLRIHAVHLNHMNRGELSFDDMSYVEDYCEYHNIPCSIVVMDIPKRAEQEGRCFEEVGREARYEVFEDIRESLGFEKVAVAHNQNDQAETVLYRMIRGSGIDGLKSMVPKRGNIIRPIIDICRVDVEGYCKAMGIDPQIDETNEMLVHDRNIIRNHIIPEIEEYLNPSIVSTLSKNAKILAFDADYLSIDANQKLEKMFKTSIPVDLMSGEEISTNLEDFNTLHFSIKSRIIRTLIECINGTLKDITSMVVDEVIRVLFNGRHGSEVSIGNVIFKIEYHKLTVSRYDAYGSKQDVSKCYEIQSESMPIESFREEYDTESYVIFVDSDKIKDELYIRKRQDGDKFKPLGMLGTKKLKNFMIDEKIPFSQRESIPLICEGEEILWVYGHRISEDYKITPETKNVTKIWLKPIDIDE